MLVTGGPQTTIEPSIQTIAPWLSVTEGARAVEFYTAALGAVETYRLEGGAGKVAVAQLTVGGAPFWVQEDVESEPPMSRGSPIRMIVTVDDPDALFRRAVEAGATPVADVHEEHGWRTGSVVDPFGHDWEFSRPTGMEDQSGANRR
jgi:PhnB protein